MAIETSVGVFSHNEFIQKCSEHSFPEGLEVRRSLNLAGIYSLKSLPAGLKVGEDLNLERCASLKSLPDGLKVGRWLDLRDCTSLTALPDGLQVGECLDIRGCDSLTALPKGLQVGDKIFVDPSFIKRYPFRDLPKILHLPFIENIKQLIIDSLQNGC